MDNIVKAAIAKWPNVPYCYGWLALDARGIWRMRDERCQALNLPGDPIRHATLLNFINRNYQHDEQGCWYFQNGPQRVYVDLETTPYIAHTTPSTPSGFALHHGEPLLAIDHVYFDPAGILVLQSATILAQINDRDLSECLSMLRIEGKELTDEDLLQWLSDDTHPIQISLLISAEKNNLIPVQRADIASLMRQHGYQQQPRPEPV